MPSKLPVSEPPLKPHVFLILLALADGPAHGYRIRQTVETHGGVRLDPGSLYRLIARLLDEELIAEHNPARDADPRRRPYALTTRGRAVLLAEADRLADLVGAVRRSKLARRPRPA